MTDVLVLGGTGWLSGRIARDWHEAGANVTCLARGERAAPAGARLLQGDRGNPEVYTALARNDWDEVVDVSSQAHHVREAVNALGARAGHWTYVSSMSAYSDDHTIGLDETGATHAPAQDGDEYDYGAQKVAAEQTVSTLGERALIVRPGLIVGDGDPSDRFGYWAAALDRAGTEDVLVPTLADRAVQVIDVDDLSAFLVAPPRHGLINAIGDVHDFGAVLGLIAAATGYQGVLQEADDAWLEAHEVQYWMGERSLPLWLPADMPGFMRRANGAYRDAGGSLRPLQDTISAVIADERGRGTDRVRRAGLSRSEEHSLLGALRG